MKLTNNQIQFIDTYLINSSVIYIDIRYEMIDHIATAVEEKMEVENLDFYDAFKDYMVENKATLMKNNKSSTFFSRVEIKKYLKTFMHPVMIVIAVLLILVYKNIDINSYFSEDFTFSNLVFVFYISIMISQTAYYYLFIKKKYYGFEKTAHILLIIYFLFPFLNSKNVFISLFFLLILIGYVFYFFKETSKFNKHKFNYL